MFWLLILFIDFDFDFGFHLTVTCLKVNRNQTEPNANSTKTIQSHVEGIKHVTITFTRTYIIFFLKKKKRRTYYANFSLFMIKEKCRSPWKNNKKLDLDKREMHR